MENKDWIVVVPYWYVAVAYLLLLKQAEILIDAPFPHSWFIRDELVFLGVKFSSACYIDIISTNLSVKLCERSIND